MTATLRGVLQQGLGILAVSAACFGLSTAFAQSNFNGPIESKEIAKGVYLLSAGSNAVLAVGSSEAILIDALVAAQADPLVKKVSEITKVPVTYVVNTHFHGDHTGTNEAFRNSGAKVIASANAAKVMGQAVPNPRGGTNPPLPEGGRPTETFTTNKTLKINGQTVRITPIKYAAHTDGDALVYIPAANVLILGDLHHSNEYPVYDAEFGCRCGSYAGNLDAYRQALKIANAKTVIVAGHGGVTNKAEVTAYVSMLEKVRDQVDAMIKQGKSADEVVAAKLLADNPAVHAGGPDNRDSFIRILYAALKTGRGK